MWGKRKSLSGFQANANSAFSVNDITRPLTRMPATTRVWLPAFCQGAFLQTLGRFSDQGNRLALTITLFVRSYPNDIATRGTYQILIWRILLCVREKWFERNQIPYLFSRNCSSSVQLWLQTWSGSGRIRSWMASMIQEGWGKKHSSSSWAGVIQFFAPTTTGGASR